MPMERNCRPRTLHEFRRRHVFVGGVRWHPKLDKVSGMIPLDLDAEIRVEYGDDNFFPSAYHIRSVNDDQTTTRVLIEPPQTTCKARDRRHAALQRSDSCCAAATQSCC